MLLIVGALLVVAGVALWSAPAALVCAGLLIMLGAVALAIVQEASRPRLTAQGPPANGRTAPQPQEAIK